jgi:hypothetical protein
LSILDTRAVSGSPIPCKSISTMPPSGTEARPPSVAHEVERNSN